MTDKDKQTQKISMSAGQKLFCLMSAVALMLTFIYSDTAISAMSDGMKLCVSTLIPSLFPFMVLSELFVRSGAADIVGRIVGAPVSWLLGVSREGSVAWLLGVVCGFPIGMKCALSLYDRGKISRAELEHLSTFCNVPSSAFLIGAVGTSLFGSKNFGLVLYAAHIIASLMIGFVGRFYFSGKRKEYFFGSGAAESKQGAAKAFSESVTSSATSMLFICAFVVFFSSFVGILRYILEDMRIGVFAKFLVFGFFEMTGGVSAASELPVRYAIPAVAIITGWSGLSVHFQLIGICGERKISLCPYFFAKIAGALLCAALTTVLANVFADSLHFSVGSVQSVLLVPSTPTAIFTLVFFGLSCLNMLARARKK